MIARCAFIAGALVAWTTAGGQARSASPASTTVEIVGPTGQHKTFGASDLAAMRSIDTSVSSHNVHGRYRGVPLGDLLRLVGLTKGDSLRGAALAQDVIVEASDKYRVVFAPAELDSGFTNKLVLLAYAKDGAPLGASEGPFRIIVPDEKRPARWVRGAVRILVRPCAP